MFTGIIEEKGIIRSVKHGAQSSVISIRASLVLQDMKKGDSVNTNGVCLTVTAIDKEGFSVDAVAETLRRTNLSTLKTGAEVNLERAVKLSDRLGGHLVSGHVDGTGTITGIAKEDNAIWMTISAEPEILKYVIEKGSIAIDGISLTVADLTASGFSVSLIPLTAQDTTLAKKMKGEKVNLECDLIGKYIERFLFMRKQTSERKIDMDYLKEHGFL